MDYNTGPHAALRRAIYRIYANEELYRVPDLSVDVVLLRVALGGDDTISREQTSEYMAAILPLFNTYIETPLKTCSAVDPYYVSRQVSKQKIFQGNNYCPPETFNATDPMLHDEYWGLSIRRSGQSYTGGTRVHDELQLAINTVRNTRIEPRVERMLQPKLAAKTNTPPLWLTDIDLRWAAFGCIKFIEQALACIAYDGELQLTTGWVHVEYYEADAYAELPTGTKTAYDAFIQYCDTPVAEQILDYALTKTMATKDRNNTEPCEQYIRTLRSRYLALEQYAGSEWLWMLNRFYDENDWQPHEALHKRMVLYCIYFLEQGSTDSALVRTTALLPESQLLISDFEDIYIELDSTVPLTDAQQQLLVDYECVICKNVSRYPLMYPCNWHVGCHACIAKMAAMNSCVQNQRLKIANKVCDCPVCGVVKHYTDTDVDYRFVAQFPAMLHPIPMKQFLLLKQLPGYSTACPYCNQTSDCSYQHVAKCEMRRTLCAAAMDKNKNKHTVHIKYAQLHADTNCGRKAPEFLSQHLEEVGKLLQYMKATDTTIPYNTTTQIQELTSKLQVTAHKRQKT